MMWQGMPRWMSSQNKYEKINATYFFIFYSDTILLFKRSGITSIKEGGYSYQIVC